ncbi:MAG: hypothetical protein ACI80F_001148 [Natronomonas sp.]
MGFLPRVRGKRQDELWVLTCRGIDPSDDSSQLFVIALVE